MGSVRRLLTFADVDDRAHDVEISHRLRRLLNPPRPT
jgi:hypothetical protein